MTFENYQTWSWAIYALSALVVMLVTLRITRNWHVSIKGFLRVTVFVLMAVPWYVEGTMGPLAPALTVSVFEGVTLGGDSWTRAGYPLLAALGLGYLVALIGLWISSRFGSRDDETDEEESSETRDNA
jgi:hypothetical protein